MPWVAGSGKTHTKVIYVQLQKRETIEQIYMSICGQDNRQYTEIR